MAIGIAFAVPSARSAILRFLGLEGVTIVRVEKLPAVKANAAVVGIRTTLDGAKVALHFEDFFSQPRLAGNALIWEHDGITYRLEGRISKAQAVRIARSFRAR